MKAWTHTGAGQLKLITESPSALNETNNVKVKIEQVLFSASDYAIYAGPSKKVPEVLGRNAVGVVSEVLHDSGSMLNKMNRVAIEPYIPCYSCGNCKNKKFAICENMMELGYNANGLLQNFVDLPSSALHQLPDTLSDEKALFLPYVAMGLSITDSLELSEGRHVAVFASTKIGLIVAQLLSYYRALPVLISNNQQLLDMAKQQGIFYTFNTETCSDIEREVQTVTGGRMCKEIVYFTNSDFNMRTVYNLASYNARICISGYGNKDSKISVSQIADKHLSIFGIYNGYGNFPRAINLLVTGKIVVDDMIGEKIPFAKLDSALKTVDAATLDLKSKIITVD